MLYGNGKHPFTVVVTVLQILLIYFIVVLSSSPFTKHQHVLVLKNVP